MTTCLRSIYVIYIVRSFFLTPTSNTKKDMVVNTKQPSSQRVQLISMQLKKMTIPKLKTCIKDHKLKIKLTQKKEIL